MTSTSAVLHRVQQAQPICALSKANRGGTVNPFKRENLIVVNELLKKCSPRDSPYSGTCPAAAALGSPLGTVRL